MYINWRKFRRTLTFIVIRVLLLMLALSIEVILSALGYKTIADFLFFGNIVWLISMGVPEELYIGIFKRSQENVRLFLFRLRVDFLYAPR